MAKGFRRGPDLKTLCVFNMNVFNNHEVTKIRDRTNNPIKMCYQGLFIASEQSPLMIAMKQTDLRGNILASK